MTQDVGRLHKERQAIEQQIADLFAFYSKQKQSSPVRLSFLFREFYDIKWTAVRSNRPRIEVHHSLWHNAIRTLHRPLPRTVEGLPSVDHCRIYSIHGINESRVGVSWLPNIDDQYKQILRNTQTRYIN